MSDIANDDEAEANTSDVHPTSSADHKRFVVGVLEECEAEVRGELHYQESKERVLLTETEQCLWANFLHAWTTIDGLQQLEAAGRSVVVAHEDSERSVLLHVATRHARDVRTRAVDHNYCNFIAPEEASAPGDPHNHSNDGTTTQHQSHTHHVAADAQAPSTRTPTTAAASATTAPTSMVLYDTHYEMLSQMEVMVRQLTVDDEAESFDVMRTLIIAMLRLQDTHEHIVLLSNDEVEQRYLIGAEESCAWSIFVDDASEEISALRTSSSSIQGTRTGEEAPANTTAALPEEEEQQQRDMVESPHPEDPPLFPVSPRLPTEEQRAIPKEVQPAVSQTLPVEIIRILEQFAHEDRTNVEQEEWEQRDMLNIEMELDRDEAIAQMKGDPPQSQTSRQRNSFTSSGKVDATQDRRVHDDSHMQPGETVILRKSSINDASPVKTMEDQLQDSRRGAHHRNDYHHGRYDDRLLSDDLRQEPLLAPAAYQVTAAEQYGRQDIMNRFGALTRRFAAAHRSPTEFKALEQHLLLKSSTTRLLPNESNGSVSPPVSIQYKRRPPGLLPAEDVQPMSSFRSYSIVATQGSMHTGMTEALSPDDEEEEAAYYSGMRAVSDDRRHERGNDDDEAQEGRTNRKHAKVVVPDAATFSRQSEAQQEGYSAANTNANRGTQSHDDEDEHDTDDHDDHDVVMREHMELQRQQRLREIGLALSDLVNEETVERELLVLASMEERKTMVDVFAGSVVEEYDWSIGAFRSRVRGAVANLFLSSQGAAAIPVMTPEKPSQGLAVWEAMTADRARRQDRHLPEYMRTPGPRLIPSSRTGFDSTSGATSSLAPSPPSRSVSRYSRASVKGATSRTGTVSRLSDLCWHEAPKGVISPFPPSSVGFSARNATSRSGTSQRVY